MIMIEKKHYIIKLGVIMKTFLNFILELFMIKKSDKTIGLSQYRKVPEKPVKKEVSIKTKDIKLSDLMRRAS